LPIGTGRSAAADGFRRGKPQSYGQIRATVPKANNRPRISCRAGAPLGVTRLAAQSVDPTIFEATTNRVIAKGQSFCTGGLKSHQYVPCS
jgi:hypothetical protein